MYMYIVHVSIWTKNLDSRLTLTETVTFTRLQHCSDVIETARREEVVVCLLSIGCPGKHDVVASTVASWSTNTTGRVMLRERARERERERERERGWVGKREKGERGGEADRRGDKERERGQSEVATQEGGEREGGKDREGGKERRRRQGGIEGGKDGSKKGKKARTEGWKAKQRGRGREGVT